jgi:hypothetical protein
VTLRDDIFPTGTPRDGNIIRTKWVGTWESQLLGIGRTTAFLTDRMLVESFAVDDMALDVIFFQRHRVEVALKLILERAGAPITPTHDLDKLRDACEAATKNAGMDPEWRAFANKQDEYIQLVGGIDPGAATFRYPVSRCSYSTEPTNRPHSSGVSGSASGTHAGWGAYSARGPARSLAHAHAADRSQLDEAVPATYDRRQSRVHNQGGCLEAQQATAAFARIGGDRGGGGRSNHGRNHLRQASACPYQRHDGSCDRACQH